MSEDDSFTYVTLQENNAVAVLNMGTAEIEDIISLGLKNHNRYSNRLDASDRDEAAKLRRWPTHGMYMPDAITAWYGHGGSYYATANEGDGREYFDT